MDTIYFYLFIYALFSRHKMLVFIIFLQKLIDSKNLAGLLSSSEKHEEQLKELPLELSLS